MNENERRVFNGLGTAKIPSGGTERFSDTLNRNGRVVGLIFDTAPIQGDWTGGDAGARVVVRSAMIGGVPLEVGSLPAPISAFKGHVHPAEDGPFVRGSGGFSGLGEGIPVRVGQVVSIVVSNHSVDPVLVSGCLVLVEVAPGEQVRAVIAAERERCIKVVQARQAALLGVKPPSYASIAVAALLDAVIADLRESQ